MRIRIRNDGRPFWLRSSYLGENISNGNWIIGMILILSGAFALYRQWIPVAIVLGVLGMLSFVWNEGVAKTTSIIGFWIAVGSGSAWVLSLLCSSVLGMPAAVGYALGLAIAIIGVVKTTE